MRMKIDSVQMITDKHVEKVVALIQNHLRQFNYLLEFDDIPENRLNTEDLMVMVQQIDDSIDFKTYLDANLRLEAH